MPFVMFFSKEKDLKIEQSNKKGLPLQPQP